MTQNLRANVVSRFLSGNGKISRATYRSSSRVRGYGRWTRGYEVSGVEEGVKVSFVMGNSTGGSADYQAKVREEAMADLEAYLSKRYTVVRERGMYGPEYLLVTAK